MGRDRRQRRRRVAAIGGTVAAAKHHRDANQAEEAVEPAAAPEDAGQAAPPDSGALAPEAIDELKQLGELHEQNVLTDEEFAREKARLLGPA